MSEQNNYPQPEMVIASGATETPKRNWTGIEISAFVFNGLLVVIPVLWFMLAGMTRSSSGSVMSVLSVVDIAAGVIALIVDIMLFKSRGMKVVPMQTTFGDTVYVSREKPKRRWGIGFLIALPVFTLLMWITDGYMSLMFAAAFGGSGY